MSAAPESVVAFYRRAAVDGRAYVTAAVWIVVIKDQYYQCSAVGTIRLIPDPRVDIASIRRRAPVIDQAGGGRGRQIAASVCLALYKEHRASPALMLADLALKYGVGINTAWAICRERHPVIRAYLGKKPQGRPKKAPRTTSG